MRWFREGLAVVLLSLVVSACGGGGGGDSAADNSTPPAQQASQVAIGTYHNCALRSDHTVKCWGLSSSGELGLGDTSIRGDAAGEMGDNLPSVDLGTGRTALELAIFGGVHTCARLDDGAVKCWGRNTFGQLGQGDTSHRGDEPNEMGDHLPAIDLGTGRTVVELSAGYLHTCALLDNGAVKCWGYNGQGRLGLGDTNARGDGPGEMGDSLPAVDLGSGRTVAHIVAGGWHTCVLLDHGAVKCWGTNSVGELGLGDTNHRGDGPSEMGDNLPTIDLGTGRTAVALTAGEAHTCALLDNGAVKCWGYGSFLGLGDSSHRGDQPNEMGDNLPAVDLGTGRTAVSITAGNGHTCAILDNGTAKCWGFNDYGQLGLGDKNVRGASAGQMGDALPAIALGAGRTPVKLVAGIARTCAVLDDDALKCWGGNTDGELGLGDTTHRGDDANEMGDQLPAVDLGQ